MSQKVSRRQFIQTTAAASAVLAVGGCSDKDAGPRFEDVDQGQVVLVRAETPEEAVARGVALMGSFSFIQRGQTVLLKPNMTGPLVPPDITSPAVLKEMIRQCYAAGAGEVQVGERTFVGMTTADTFGIQLYEGGGSSMLDVVESVGGVFRPFDDEPWVEVHPPGAVDFDAPLLIPSALDDVDHYINLPALKTHYIAGFTMTLKNFFGCVHPDTRTGQVHDDPRNDTDPDREKRMFAQMNLAFDPVVNVMDGIISRTTGGPTPPGDTHETNLILLGKDRVAMDAVGLAILRYVGTEPDIESQPVWNQPQLAEAVRVGIGVSGPDEITLVGEGVEELSDIEALLRET